VIVPNSKIGKSQVVNYSFPDPRYRVEIEISVAYGSDVDQVTQIPVDAVKEVEGVLKNYAVDA
jgi:small-conductance mechanosensitive channel